MNQTIDQKPSQSLEDLRQQILVEMKNVQRLAPADYTENCTNVVMSLIQSALSVQDRTLRIKGLEDAKNSLQTVARRDPANVLVYQARISQELKRIDYELEILTSQQVEKK